MSAKRPKRRKPPRDYVTEWRVVDRSDQEKERWYDVHGTYPLPRLFAHRIYFRNTRCYRHLDMLRAHDPDRQFTLEDIKAIGGGTMSLKVAQAIFDDLKAKQRGRDEEEPDTPIAP